MAIKNIPSALAAALGRFFGPSRDDRAAGFELAVSTRDFTRRAKGVVDDKLSFSATLMRAGEVEAANRLLAEVEEEVLEEEAALMERVAEVKVAADNGQPPVTRLRLARALAVAMLGSAVLASSAIGMTVVGMFFDENDAEVGSDRPGDSRLRERVFGASSKLDALKHVRIAGVNMNLTPAEFRRLDELTRGRVNEGDLESFLLGLLPPTLAQKVQSALVLASETMPTTIEEPIVVAARPLGERKEQPKKEEEPAPEDEASKAADEGTEEPSPSPSGSPSPSESGDEEDGSGDNIPLVGGGDD